MITLGSHPYIKTTKDLNTLLECMQSILGFFRSNVMEKYDNKNHLKHI